MIKFVVEYVSILGCPGYLSSHNSILSGNCFLKPSILCTHLGYVYQALQFTLCCFFWFFFLGALSIHTFGIINTYIWQLAVADVGPFAYTLGTGRLQNIGIRCSDLLNINWVLNQQFCYIRCCHALLGV